MGIVLPFFFWYSLYCHLLIWFVLLVHMESLYCAAYLKSGSQAPGKCHMFSCSFSLKEINFCMTFGVRHWAAELYQLMVLLGGKLIAGCQADYWMSS